jgi:glycosyltransferase involved in cell wall biosynthesis
MKILFYFGGFAPIGGIETFCKNLLLYLQAQNYDCRLLCWGQNSPLLKSIKQATIKITRSPWQWGCRWDLPDWLVLPLGFQQVKQADIVIFGKLLPNKILKQLRLQAGSYKKFAYITPYRPSPPKNAEEQQSFLAALNNFDLILVQASVFKEDLLKVGYKGRVETIPYIPQKPGMLQSFHPTEPFKIGFLGRLVEDKNIPLLIEAFYYFQDKWLQIYCSSTKRKPSLHIFGDGHLREQLSKLAEKLGITNYVTFYGNIPNDKIESAIASCHLFAFTSHIEGQCLAALEILGCGRPIVATDAGALPDILSDSRLGLIAESNDPNTFADSLMQIANLIEQKLISPEIIRSAYLERYAPDKVGERYKQVLDSLL